MYTILDAINGHWDITKKDLLELGIDPNKYFKDTTIAELEIICTFLQIGVSEFIDYTV
jgi:hypothetical protein